MQSQMKWDTVFLAEMIDTTLIYMLIFGDFCSFYTSNPGRMLILLSFYGEKEQVYMNRAE